MSRAKGTPKTGGRVAGTPNKVTGTLKEFVTNLIEENRGQIEKDLQKLEPKERLVILERFMQYVLPKQRETGVEITETKEVERYDLSCIPDDIIKEMANRIQEAEHIKATEKLRER